ncbi:MAG: hypothetical protein AAB229_09660 [Candidatus Hydrogenedentota bacterium]
MKSSVVRGTRFRLFLAALLFQLTFASGHVFSFDEVAIADIAAGIVNEGKAELHFGPEMRLYYKPGPNGEQYSKFGIGMSAALIPFYMVGKIFGFLAGPAKARLIADIIASFANCFFVALIAPCFFTLLRLAGVPDRSARITTLLLLFCTTLSVYGRGLFNDALTALAVTLAVQMHLANRPAWSGAAVAIAFATRAEYALLAPSIAVILCISTPLMLSLSRHGGWRKLVRFFAPIIFMGLLLALYNYARFGSPTDQGTLTDNPHDVFSTPFHIGLFGLIASPGKGVLWYAAPVWLAIWGCVDLGRRNRLLLALFAVIIVPLLLLHAHWHSWMGGWSYGPRRLVALMPVIMIPAGFIVERLLTTSRGRTIVVTTAVVGFAAQLAGLTTNFMSYLQWAQDHKVSTLWSFEHSSMIGQLHWLFGTGWVDLWYTNLLGLSLPAGLIGFALTSATAVATIYSLASDAADSR